MAATTTPFFIAEPTLQAGGGGPLSFPIAAGSSFTVIRGSYIEVEHDAVDGFATALEQWQAFQQLFVDRVGAQVDFALDNGSGTNMPASNPDRLSVLYYLDTSGGSPSTWILRLRWGNLNNFKKEYLWKRVYRLNEHQQRDNDAPEMLLLSASGISEWLTTAAGLAGSQIPQLELNAGQFTTAERTNTTFSIELVNNLTNGSVIADGDLRKVFDDYIVYRTSGRINPASLSWITDSVAASVLTLTFDVGTGSDLVRGTTAMEIATILASGYVYSIYDRLAFELAQDTDTLGVLSAAGKSIGYDI